MEHKKYEIDSFERLCNLVTDDNLQSVMVDMYTWLSHYVNIVKTVKEKKPGTVRDTSLGNSAVQIYMGG